jgi:signal transduction histidine kinase
VTATGKTLDASVGPRSNSLTIESIRVVIAALIKADATLPRLLETVCESVDAMIPGCATGIVLAEVSGTRISRIVGPGLPGRCREHLERQRLDFRGSNAAPLRSLVGETLGLVTIHPVRDASTCPVEEHFVQQLAQLLAALIERARGLESLRRSEEFLTRVQRLSSTGIFVWRVASREFGGSDEVYRILEADRSAPLTLEFIGSRVHPEDAPRFRASFERARRVVGDFESEYRLQMPDRSIKYVRVGGHGNRSPDGELEYIGAIQDVTRSRFAEKTLDKLRSELTHLARVASVGALTASIAHEVNQPLCSCITNASTCVRMLDEMPLDLEGARETARRAIRDGRRAAEVIARLRALFGKKGAPTECVNLNDAAREVLALASGELRRNRVIVRMQLAKNLPTVTGDRVQLQQVMLNLILNALDAMSGVHHRPRRLLIKTQLDEDDGVRVLVRDAGIGLKPDDLEQFFEAFYTTKDDGMGIGLSVSRSIIESHRGRLWGRPNAGGGATFCFSIPVEAWAARSHAPREACRSTPADGPQVGQNA